jgi:hypothetical protein
MIGADSRETLAENYLRFGRISAAGKSPLYQELCEGVANDPEMLEFLSRQPPPKQQPNLLLAGTRFLLGLQASYPAFRETVLQHQDELAEVINSRRTQTNEPGRCAVLLPVLCQLPQPLALLEVGTAAGLCLLVDRYGYDYGAQQLGDDRVVFECAPHGAVPVPAAVPEVVWRAGIDLEPVDLDDDDSVRWLEALVWPEEQDRLKRLRAAIDIAREERPTIVRGNLLDRLEEVAADAPRRATLVVFHTAVLAYLTQEEREQFTALVRTISAHWISSEGADVVPNLPVPRVRPISPSHFVIASNGQRSISFCDGHGRWLQWL